MKSMVFNSSSEKDTEQLGMNIAEKLNGGEVIALFGGMGMGKTAFVRGLVRGLGFTGEVSSPTFAIVHEYNGGRLNVYHFDMYRIESWDDLYVTSFFDYIESNGVTVTEWSENIEGALPNDFIKIEISKGEGENERIFKIDGIEI